MLHAFVDTNVLLHCRLFDEIPWHAELDSDAVSVAIAPVVIRELDKHKTTGVPKLKKRAATVLGKFFDLWSDSLSAELSSQTSLQAIACDPSFDFASLGLSVHVQDDWLIASMLQFREDNAGSDIVLVTGDMGLTLKGRAHGL